MLYSEVISQTRGGHRKISTVIKISKPKHLCMATVLIPRSGEYRTIMHSVVIFIKCQHRKMDFAFLLSVNTEKWIS